MSYHIISYHISFVPALKQLAPVPACSVFCTGHLRAFKLGSVLLHEGRSEDAASSGVQAVSCCEYAALNLKLWLMHSNE